MTIAIIGFLMGILSGLAIGGGTLLVPALVLLMGVEQHTAQGVCLAAFVPTAVIAVLTHYRQHNIDLRLVLWLSFGSVAGAFFGSWLANLINAQLLRHFFGYFLILMGCLEFFVKPKLRH